MVAAMKNPMAKRTVKTALFITKLLDVFWWKNPQGKNALCAPQAMVKAHGLRVLPRFIKGVLR